MAKDENGKKLRKWWWINFLPLGWSTEENQAGIRLVLTALILFGALYIPIAYLLTRIGLRNPIIALATAGLCLLGAFVLSRSILSSANPDLLRKADENATKRLNGQRSSKS